MAAIRQAEPLLAQCRGDSQTGPTSGPSRLGSVAVGCLSVFRPLVGASLLIAPKQLCQLLQPNTGGEPGVLLPRLLGIREIAIGVSLWISLKRERLASGGGLSQALLMNLAVDVVDAVACGMIVAGKFPESYGAELFGIGALFFVMLGATGLRSI